MFTWMSSSLVNVAMSKIKLSFPKSLSSEELNVLIVYSIIMYNYAIFLYPTIWHCSRFGAHINNASMNNLCTYLENIYMFLS